MFTQSIKCVQIWIFTVSTFQSINTNTDAKKKWVFPHVRLTKYELSIYILYLQLQVNYALCTAFYIVVAIVVVVLVVMVVLVLLVVIVVGSCTSYNGCTSCSSRTGCRLLNLFTH